MHLSLYRKYRPMLFSDVCGQEHITKTLQNEIKSGNIHHAYIFTGSRGTGKTTCAKIMAKAVNCLNPKDGNPCLECEACKAIDNGAVMDIVEIDAASNTGVDNIRDLKEEAMFTPSFAKYRVFIIDEVHMLSDSAFNALLKILEEPPAHVIFILATTEIHKVLPTVLSRCQRFDFKRIGKNIIADRIKMVASKEGLSLNDNAAYILSGLSEGSMRDALSLLEQCSAYSNDINEETVALATGTADRSYIFEMMEYCLSKDTASAVALLENLYSAGKDLRRFLEELTFSFRDAMICKCSKNTEAVLQNLPDEIEKLKAFCSKASLDFIMRSLEILREENDKTVNTFNIKVSVQFAIVRLCSSFDKGASGSVDLSDVYDRLEKLERGIANGKTAIAPAKTAEGPAVKPVASPKQEAQAKVKAEAPKAMQQEAAAEAPKAAAPAPQNAKALDCWGEIISELSKVSPPLAGFLGDSEAYVNGEFLLIVSKNEFFNKMIRQDKNAVILAAVAEKVTGTKYRIKVSASQMPKEETLSPIEALKKRALDMGVPVNED